MLGARRTLLVRSQIVKVKTRALRKGVWFRVLTKAERACVELSIVVVERVRSCLLRRVLTSILKKLEAAMESRVQRLMRETGVRLASKLSQIAQKWGNESAFLWAGDSGFVQYLTINYMNELP